MEKWQCHRYMKDIKKTQGTIGNNKFLEWSKEVKNILQAHSVLIKCSWGRYLSWEISNTRRAETDPCIAPKHQGRDQARLFSLAFTGFKGPRTHINLLILIEKRTPFSFCSLHLSQLFRLEIYIKCRSENNQAVDFQETFHSKHLYIK